VIRSRAIAVAPAMGYLGIFALKYIDEIQGEVREADSDPSYIFKPTRQDRYLQIEGLILKMDFLRSSTSDTNRVILLLLVANRGKTNLLLYSWDNREGPRTARPMPCSGQRVDPEDSLPLMLIPSSKCLSFTTVYETHLTVWENLATERATNKSFPNPRALPGERPVASESSSLPPLWVQWAKPRRHAKHLETHDDFYLIREDGQLRFFIVDYDLPQKLAYHHGLGSLDVSVDQAFAMVAAPAELGADVFLVGGDMFDGGVWHCEARGKPHCVQSLPNMAPMRDMLITGPQDHFSTTSGSRHGEPQRFFTCSGKVSNCSYVNEIRFGLESNIVWSIEHEDASSVTKLWILKDRKPERVLLLMSHPLLSSIVSLDPASGDLAVGDITTYPGMELESPTLAAACTEEGLTIQLTRDSVNICVLPRGPRRASMPYSDTTCVSAAIEASSGRFVVANRSPQGFHLHMGDANMKMDISLGSQQYDLQEEPTALTIIPLRDALVVLAGLSDGTLLVLCADAKNNLHLLSSYYVQHIVADAQSCTVSSVEVLSRPSALQGLVLCGLRTGILVLLSMSLDLNGGHVKVNMSFVDQIELGSTRLDIVREQERNSINSGALISCESDLRRISLLDEVGLAYGISQIWMTKEDDASESQSELHPVLNAVSRMLDYPAGGMLVCVSNDGILISSMLAEDRVVPRRHKIKGPPEKLTYSKYLKKLVVAINEVEVKSSSKTSEPRHHRSFRPALELVDPDVQTIAGKKDDKAILGIGKAGDRIRNLAEWRPANDTAHFELIVVGIDSDAPDHKLPSGRLLFVNVGNTRKIPFNALKVSVGNRYSGRPVYCLHPHGMSSILVGAGNDVILEHFDMTTRRLSTLATFTLPSPATSLSASNSLIYASTLHHSLIVLRKTDATFETISTDTLARNVRGALILDEFALLNTTTGEGSCLIGLSQNHTDKTTPQCLLFEAHFPLVLESIKPSNPLTEPRRTFHSITMDGTLHRYQILSHDEWALLRFLEGFFRVDFITDLSRLGLDAAAKERERQAGPHPTEMHVQGDLLVPFVEEGASKLRTVLIAGKREGGRVAGSSGTGGVKTEQQEERGRRFRELAVPIVGEGEDLVAEVVKWLRGLMRLFS
jgi:hypothetical protein